ncbi:cystathionine beta-lyase [Caldanaerobius fijiensis DSM 17918]|uniref:cysteine-S-conjugate beta-lyase n=1 Tax=Caldanaerobius fijiensis DSM 17918 TaxID=1121256 RepID=A0A1M5C799_9THEO|nr:PLP-dependent aspartate aminotransferase family protein [Caldanaerobius fijiensis]SHF50654.1 cystathionine beta-lyase [Caldanaerobius fijiensis DSM 17918]
MKYATKLLHNGNEIDKHTGALSIPIYQTSTFKQDDVDNPPLYDYSRSGNPTRTALENTMAILEGGTSAYAFSSGMAAMSAVLSLLDTGDHVIAAQDIYGGTYRALTRHFSKYNIQVSFVDTTDTNKIEDAIKPNTKMLILETPSNPLLKITDLKACAELAKKHNIITVVDNTFMSPYLQRPLELGIDIVVHSATKFIGGHSDVLGGIVVVKDKDLAKQIYFVQNTLGAVLNPHDCWLLLRGIKTLKVRLDAEQQGAIYLAQWLKKQDFVKSVYYPGLPEHPGHDLHLKQAYGPGAVLSFEVKDINTAKKITARVKLFFTAVSLGGVESILSYPAKMSHASVPWKERQKLGITDELLRISVGLEDPEDLSMDILNAVI